jgi:hypothetical protein
MENHKTIIIVAGLFFIFIFLSGFWVRSDGKPYHSFVLTIHKLIALAAGVVLCVALYWQNQAVGLGSLDLTAVFVTGMLFVITVLSGGIWSIEKDIPGVVLSLHQVSLFLSMFSTGVLLYLVF